MPDVTPLTTQSQEEIIEISIPVEQTGLPVSQETPAVPSGENVTAGANENTQSNPQSELSENQPQKEELSTTNTQIQCALDDCHETFSSLEEVKEHMRAVHKKEEMTPKPEKHAGGRPCLYCENKDKYQTLADDYVNKAMAKTGEKITIPYMEELAILLNLSENTLRNWVNKKIMDTEEPEHPELVETIDKLLTIQKLRLLQRTIGRYNPTGAIFQLKANHGFIETEKKVLAGDTNEPLLIEIVNEKPQLEAVEETANE